MKYEKIIAELEKLKANELDNGANYDAIEVLNETIYKLEYLQSESE